MRNKALNCGAALALVALKRLPYHPTMRFLPRFFIKNKRLDLANIVVENLILAILRTQKPPQTPPPITPLINRDDMYLALKDTFSALEKGGFRPFLAYGTLLGWARENSFLERDHDIDLGLIWDNENSIEQLISCLTKQGYKVIFTPELGKTSLLKIRHPNGIHIDILLFIHASDNTIRSHITLFGHTFERKKSYFGLRTTTFEGVAVQVPDPAHRFLDEFYGDWQTPPAFYATFLSPKIAVDFSHPAFQYLAKSHLYQCLRYQNKSKIIGCLTTILAKDNSLYWKTLENRIYQWKPLLR